MRRLIRVDGTTQDFDKPLSIADCKKLTGANTFDTVTLRHLGNPLRVMLVDDTGMVDGKPVNPEASRLYWANCRPGATHPICGDVVIVPDGDFA